MTTARMPEPAAPVWILAVALFAGHILLNATSAFEFHRDEFLYLAMGDHLQWWRMDFPPFIAALANVTRAVAGDGIVAIRLGPALAASALVVIAGRMARMLGGSPRAQLLAALAILVAPVVLRPGMLYQPVIFDQLWWTCALGALILRQTTDNPRWWLVVGVALGLGLLTKFSIGFIGIGIVVGMLATPMRRDLATRWPWLALGIALAIGSASLVGQWRLDFPIFWQMRDLQAGQLERRPVWAFLADQPLNAGPITFLLAMVGIWWMIRGPLADETRAAGIAMVVSWLLLSVSHGKAYYGAPIYAIACAAGALALDDIRGVARRRVAFLIVTLLMVLTFFAMVPLTLPILSPASTARYAAQAGITQATETNYGTVLPLPQDFADMLGWKEMAQATADVWRQMSDADRGSAILAARNYGEAGALDYYGPKMGLPKVVSGAGSYWFFGPGDKPGTVMVVVGEGLELLLQLYESCTVQRTVGSPWAVDEEQRVPITVCRNPRQSIQTVWPQFNPARAR